MEYATLQVRIAPEMKEQAEAVFAGIGMKPNEAIRVFLQQCINEGGLPFRPHLKIPNAETLQAMQETDRGETEETTLVQLRQDMGL